uniref:Uncharacterized protein n=1 Tax=Anopheles culicifacies TaxID=139723 RepID=A0A182MJJ2_9DIPT
MTLTDILLDSAIDSVLCSGRRAYRPRAVITGIIISDVTIGLVTLPTPSGGSPAPTSLGQRRWRRRLREAGRANAGPQQHHQQHHYYSPVPQSTDDKMKYLTAGHRESYTLVARKRYMKRMLYVH